MPISDTEFAGDLALSLDVEFEENLMFSRYDVDVYLNNTKLATIEHGKEYHEVLNVAAGDYTLTFTKSDDQSVSGVSHISVTQDTSYQCEIHAKNDKVKIDKVKTNAEILQSGNASDTSAISTLKVGETGELNGVSIVLKKVKTSKGSSFNKPDSGNIFLLCEFEVANNSGSDVTVSTAMSFDAYCDDYKYSSSFSALLEVDNQLDGTIEPGRKLKGNVGFEIPKDWKTAEIEFTPDFWSNDKLTFIVENK